MGPTDVPARDAANPGDCRLCVLASGSSGNCSVLRAGGSTVLIDAGLSPRRTRAELRELGIGADEIDAIVLTHLDTDHFHAGWGRALPASLPVFVHATHERAARRRGVGRSAVRTFTSGLRPAAAIEGTSVLTDHDDTGTAAFRFVLAGGGELGFATDLGRPSGELARHLAGVDVLAVESNYCPRMQLASGRPRFLVDRVMGGAGHLSNEECAALVGRIGPREHVVLLHLSRECNDPELAVVPHRGRQYALTVSSQTDRTGWIRVEPGAPGGASPVKPTARVRAPSLFGHLVGGRGEAAG